MKVALYARVSTRDKDQDPEVQLIQLRRYAQYKGYEVVGEYKDQCSGKKPVRPGLQHLERDAEAHRFDAVVVVRIDRIMRSLAHFLNPSMI